MTGKTLGLLGRLTGALRGGASDPVPAWQPATGPYPRLLRLDPQLLATQGGLYLLWHLGVRPQWIRAGYSSDLGAAVDALAKAPEIAAFDVHDGPFISWAACDVKGAAGWLAFLVQRLNPVLQDLPLVCDAPMDQAAKAVACPLPPGTKDDHG